MSQCVVDYAHETQEYPGKANFLLGAQLYPSGNCPRGFLRSMINPSADNNRSSSCWHPKFDRMFNETHGGNDMWCYVDVHWSSGVANRAFYLAAKGLNQTCDQAVKPAAIGLTSACNIFYRALTSYLSKVADYHELRTATVQAAKDLFGASSPEASSLAQAWDIVGAPRAPYPNTNAPKCQPGFATAASCIRGLV
ncbi:Bacillolysin [Monoraphidium neglectum]|uniref:Bacillolysin n=1 Tax=Monoraphidium neglectum TaxID=145388 RepID=A0A0D2K7X4_9CHLO|nr:Bacillolysin [Monoraphidium neglectum]KIY92233.1 Bacillolysin [Monoraphidium neglectum]|eukprot:XP_013891253.1 Bacillolysin [Monoraphidium neglectum]